VTDFIHLVGLLAYFSKNFSNGTQVLFPKVARIKKSLTFAVLLKTDEIQP